MVHKWSLTTVDMRRQKEPGAPESPKGILVNWKRPLLVQKADLSFALFVNPSIARYQVHCGEVRGSFDPRHPGYQG